MKFEVKKLPRGQAELTIELTVEEYQPFLDLAAKHISGHHRIPGFRPGKAGLDVVIRQVGEGEVWNEALEPAVRKTFIQAVDESKLMTVGSPHIDVAKLAPGNPVIYKAVVSLLPEIKLPDYTKIKVKRQPVTVESGKVDSVLRDLQLRRAKEVAVTRPAKPGDKVDINFETFVDKVPIEHGSQKNFPLMLGENTFIPGFEDQLVGLAAGQQKEFSLHFPQTYHEKSLAGRLADFKVTVNQVSELERPELNDAFAVGLGQFKNLDELKKQINDNLIDEATAKEQQRLEDAIFDALITQSTFDDLPDILVDTETKKMVDELEQNLARQGVKLEDYLNHLNKKREALLLEFVPQAIKRVKSALITRAVSRQNQVDISVAEVDAEISKTLEVYGGNPEIEKQLQTPEYREYLRNILGARKVIEHLKAAMVQD